MRTCCHKGMNCFYYMQVLFKIHIKARNIIKYLSDVVIVDSFFKIYQLFTEIIVSMF